MTLHVNVQRLILIEYSIDGLNTSTIGLLDLRRRLAIIPQDAALFQGTIRDNLDPRHVHDDTELWSVLDHARLKEYVSSLPGQLDAAVNEGGKYYAFRDGFQGQSANAMQDPT